MSSPLKVVRAVNRKLVSFLLEFTPGPGHREQSSRSCVEIAMLLSEVLEVSRLANESGAVRDAAFDLEWNKYRKNLNRLHGVLPLLEKRLRTERSALEAERGILMRMLRQKREGS